MKQTILLLLVFILFTVPVLADTPVSSCQTLTTPNERYYLTQDVTATGGSCFELAAAGVELDLNGNTLFFDQEGGDRAAVVMESSATNGEIHNGAITETSEILPGNGGGGDAIRVYCDGCTIHDLDIETLSFYSSAIQMGGGAITVEIYDNTLARNTQTAYNEMDDYGIFDTYGLDMAAHVIIHDNTFEGRAWQINQRHGSAEIYNNIMHPVKKNRNPYAMRLKGTSGEVYNNVITSTNGRGLFLAGGSNYNFYNNYVETIEEDVPGVDVYEDTIAVRVRGYGGYNNTFINNTVITYTGNSDLNAGAFVIGPVPLVNSNDIVKDNIFIAKSRSPSLEAFALAIQDSPTFETSIFENNRIVSNSIAVQFGGFNGGANDALLTSNTIVRENDPITTTFRAIDMNRGGGPSLTILNNRFIDTRFVNTLPFEDVTYRLGGDEKGFSAEWYVTLETQTDSGNAQGNVPITIYDRNNVERFSGTTNVAGQMATITLVEFNEQDDGNNIPSRTYLSPYTIEADFLGGTETLTVDLDNSKSIIIQPSSTDVTNSSVVVICLDGETQSCGWSNTGACSLGTQSCSGGSWGVCSGAVNPVTEQCSNGVDDDCDGYTDDADTIDCATLPPPTGNSGPIEVDSTYGSYNVDAIDDDIIDAEGGTATTWASEGDASSPHWVILRFDDNHTIENATIWWAYNSGRSAYMTSQEVRVEYWNGNNYVTVATLSPDQASEVSTSVSFNGILTDSLRFYQEPGMGPLEYSVPGGIMWLTEIDYGVVAADQGSCTLPYDADCNDCISSGELVNSVLGWYTGSITELQLIANIQNWRTLC